MWSTGCCVSAFWMSFSGVGDVFIPRTLNEKKPPGAPDWEQLFRAGVFLRYQATNFALSVYSQQSHYLSLSRWDSATFGRGDSNETCRAIFNDPWQPLVEEQPP